MSNSFTEQVMIIWAALKHTTIWNCVVQRVLSVHLHTPTIKNATCNVSRKIFIPIRLLPPHALLLELLKRARIYMFTLLWYGLIRLACFFFPLNLSEKNKIILSHDMSSGILAYNFLVWSGPSDRSRLTIN